MSNPLNWRHRLNWFQQQSSGLPKKFFRTHLFRTLRLCSVSLATLLLLSLMNTVAAQIIVFTECNFQGKATTLPPGLYDTQGLRNAGVADDSIASIVVPDGFSTTLYEDDRFDGRTGTLYAASSCLDRDQFENTISSLSVQARGNEQAALNAIAKRFPNRNSTAGVTLYSFCDYRGVEVVLSPGEYRLSDLQDAGINNNDISSLKVPRGYQVSLFANDFFRGQSVVFDDNDNCLRDNGIDEQVSSVIIRQDERAVASSNANANQNTTTVPTEVVAYSECGYVGTDVTLPPGEYKASDLQSLGMPNNAISSLRVPPGYIVSIYENDFFRGAGRVLEGDDRCLVGDQLNDKISSIVVEAAATPGSSNQPSSVTANSSSAAAAVYTKCGFEGSRAGLDVGTYNVDDLLKLGIRENSISSVKVNPGYRVDLYFFDFQRGKNGYLIADDNCLTNDGFDDEISSIKVSKVEDADSTNTIADAAPVAAQGAAEVYGQCDFVGQSVALQPGRYTQEKLRQLGIGNDAIASLKVQPGNTVVLYDNGQMRGQGVAFKADDPCLDDNGLYRKVSAVVIVPDRNAQAGSRSGSGNSGTSNSSLSGNNTLSNSTNNAGTSLAGGSAAVEAGLKCVGLYVQRNICESRRWNDMRKRCNLDEVPSLIDGYLENHVKAGNCTTQFWDELQRRVKNPTLR